MIIKFAKQLHVVIVNTSCISVALHMRKAIKLFTHENISF